MTPSGNQMAGPQKTAKQKILRSERGNLQAVQQSTSRAVQIPARGNGQSRSNPVREATGRAILEAAGRAVQIQATGNRQSSSSPGSGWSCSSPGSLEGTRRCQHGTVHSMSSTRATYSTKRVLAQSMPNLYPNLGAEVVSPDSKAASMT
jgi:hypothetical protein